jgi:hypothetical protein
LLTGAAASTTPSGAVSDIAILLERVRLRIDRASRKRDCSCNDGAFVGLNRR